MATIGHVYIVGAGPGDPGLVTVTGARAIAEADVILYDALAPAALLRAARADAELVFAGKRAGRRAMSQPEIEDLLVSHARAGKSVVRLKGGDPFVFGRGGEEALACRRAGVPFTVVSGVTSAIAAPAYAGIPVTHRGLASSFLVITGSEAGDGGAGVDWELAAKAETLVVLMGMAALEDSVRRLLAAGKPPATPAACIRWGTRPDQQVVSGILADIAAKAAAAGLSSPVVTVVGGVAGLAADLAWFEPGSLAGRRVVVTRPHGQAGRLAARLEALGAYVVEAPVISICHRPLDDAARVALAAQHDWWVFASANAVQWAFDGLAQSGRDSRALAATRVAAVGEATAEAVRQHGVQPDFVPARGTSACLGAELPLKAGERVLLPVSALDDGALAGVLSARGARVDQVVAYDTVFEPLGAERCSEVAEADVIAFTSASTARALQQALGKLTLPSSAQLVSIGPQTSGAVVAAFGRVDAEATRPDLDALVEAVKEALQ